jgi:hypothetical protein
LLSHLRATPDDVCCVRSPRKSLAYQRRYPGGLHQQRMIFEHQIGVPIRHNGPRKEQKRRLRDLKAALSIRKNCGKKKSRVAMAPKRVKVPLLHFNIRLGHDHLVFKALNSANRCCFINFFRAVRDSNLVGSSSGMILSKSRPVGRQPTIVDPSHQLPSLAYSATSDESARNCSAHNEAQRTP